MTKKEICKKNNYQKYKRDLIDKKYTKSGKKERQVHRETQK